jgi:hypothetical protein
MIFEKPSQENEGDKKRKTTWTRIGTSLLERVRHAMHG